MQRWKLCWRGSNTAKEREPVDPTLMVDVEYKCEQTNFDTVLTYAKLDLWAKFQDFQVRIRDAIVKRQALDRIMIGFMDVNAMMIVIPRISSPALTAQEIAEMDPADLTAMSVEVVTFLLKKSVLAGLPTA